MQTASPPTQATARTYSHGTVHDLEEPDRWRTTCRVHNDANVSLSAVDEPYLGWKSVQALD
jgi:hypothetical protein